MIQPGDVLNETYQVDTALGLGSFGHVWRATEIATGQKVAIKVASEQSQTDLLRREAWIAAQIVHPNIARLHTIADLPEGGIGLVYDFIDGTNLRTLLTLDPKPGLPATVAILRQLLDALGHLHRHHLIHRDVKPSNIQIARDGRPVLLDLGVAGHLRRDTQTTQIGQFSGSLRYMAPEQLGSAPQGPMADLYGLALVAVEMRTGRAAQNATNLYELLEDARAERFDLDGVEADLLPFLTACLHRDPSRRPQSADAAARLLPVLGPQTGHTTPPTETGAPWPEAWPEAGPEAGSEAGPEARPKVQTPAPERGGFAPAPQGAPFLDQTLMPAPIAPSDLPPELELHRPEAGGPPPASPPHRRGPWGLAALLALLCGGAILGILAPDLVLDLPNRATQWASQITPRQAVRGAALMALGLGVWVGGRALRRQVLLRSIAMQSKARLSAIDMIQDPEADDKLSRTIMVEIHAWQDLAKTSGDQLLTLSMIKLARNMMAAPDLADQHKAMEMFLALHEKLSARLSPWWVNYDAMVARGISAAGLVTGAILAVEGVRGLF